jgi:hypothetical protein
MKRREYMDSGLGAFTPPWNEDPYSPIVRMTLLSGRVLFDDSLSSCESISSYFGTVVISSFCGITLSLLAMNPTIGPKPTVPLEEGFQAKLFIGHRLRLFRDQKRGARAGPPLPGVPGITRGFIGSRPSRCSFLRASLRARRMASAFSRTLLSEGFS